MARPRRSSTASSSSAPGAREQELSSMYDYLAKVILLGPSGSGKSCLLHRFVKDEWRVVSSQTIGVEFASKIVKVGTGSRRKRIKLQLWDTAGTERFRSVSRSYYRGAAGAILVYDVSSRNSFRALPTFLYDARALASPQLTLLLAGNKSDLAEDNAQGRSGGGPHAPETLIDAPIAESTPLLRGESREKIPPSTFGGSSQPATGPTANIPSTSLGGAGAEGGQTAGGSTETAPPKPPTLGTKNTATIAPEGREVSVDTAAAWATSHDVKVAVEVSALSGDGVDELFSRLARMILTRIELGEIDPDDPQSGIQYGDASWNMDGNGSMRSGMSGEGSTRRRGTWRRGTQWVGGMRDWEEVFRLDYSGRRRRGCC